MKSVTQRIKEIKQPTGGYINPKEFEIIKIDDHNKLYDEENIAPGLIGIVVDYMTRYLNNSDKEEAFKISLMGADKVNELQKANRLLQNITGLNDLSIESACKLSGYDVCYRAGVAYYKDVDEINPNKETISNIKIMIQRSLIFCEKYGPIIDCGMTFEGGYTSIISAGDADFITKDTLWDFKVTKNPPKKEHTLQLIIYYLLGLHSYKYDFSNIKKIGIYNPRMNYVYQYEIKNIAPEVLKEIENHVIGYEVVEENNLLFISDIMKIMGCSRHVVMKYYTQYDLPLRKEKNKYAVNKNEFFIWLEKQKEEQERLNRIILAILITIILIILLN